VDIVATISIPDEAFETWWKARVEILEHRIKALEEAQEPPPPWRTVWAPENAFIAAKFGSGHLSAPATRYRAWLGRAPDGSEAVEIQAYGGEPNDLCQYKHTLPDGTPIHAEAVRVSVEGWLEAGYAFNPKGSGKFPLGMWIGAVSGTGYRAVIANHAIGRSQPGFNLTAANLGHVYGPWATDAGGAAVDLPVGRWFQLVMTVRLNAPGAADGSAVTEVWAGGVKLGEARRQGLVFRDTAALPDIGPHLLEMWGGSPLDSPSVMPPKDQKSWWRNWRFEVP
jgi:hypothetical protein